MQESRTHQIPGRLDDAGHRASWLPNGGAAFAEMERQIEAAGDSVRLESYLVRPDGPAEALRAALLRAVRRGVRVRILIDAYGSAELPADFFAELSRLGADVRVFNPRRLLRLTFRNHRKLLVCDGRVAIVGGFNIGPEYSGDGVTRGWRDFGMVIAGPVACALADSFEAMFELAEFTPAALRRFRATQAPVTARSGRFTVLTSGPGMPQGELRRALRRDLERARSVLIVAAYFLPPARIRRLLRRCAQRGGRVRVMLAGPTDVPAAKLAAEHHYARLLSAGAEIYEYQPQVLHGKGLIIDDVAYIGSCNLDARSLRINYELLLRIDGSDLVASGHRMLLEDLERCRRVLPGEWAARRSPWRAFKSSAAHFLLARIDPFVAQRKLKALV